MAPSKGALAPDFELPLLNAENQTIRLSDLKDQFVVLAIGSHSCELMMRQVPAPNELYGTYKDRMTFFFIYTKEAHSIETKPVEGPRVEDERFSAVRWLPQHRSLEERACAATVCSAEAKIEMPVLLDNFQDEVSSAYVTFDGLPGFPLG